MEKSTRYIAVYTTAWICIRVLVYGTGLSVAVKGAKWVNRVAKAHSITENLFDSLSEIE